MNLGEAAARSDDLVKALRATPADALVVLERSATEVAKAVRADAARHGHRVGVAVVRKPTGVRVTVTGPKAPQYRLAVERALQSKLPGAKVEIRAMITRRAK